MRLDPRAHLDAADDDDTATPYPPPAAAAADADAAARTGSPRRGGAQMAGTRAVRVVPVARAAGPGKRSTYTTQALEQELSRLAAGSDEEGGGGGGGGEQPAEQPAEGSLLARLASRQRKRAQT